MRDYDKGVIFRLTTDFSSAAMDTRELENYVFPVLREITSHQESCTLLN